MLKDKLKLYLLYLIFTSTTVFAASPTEIANPPLPNESPADYDFRMYARTFGVSIQEAKRRFNLRHKIGNLEEQLRQDNPDSFAGLWLEHSPTYRLVAKFTTTPKKDISAYTDTLVAAVTDIEPAEVSLADLEKTRTEALDAVASEGNIPIESDIDVKKNRVELYVVEKDYLKSHNAVQRRGIQFPNNIAIVKVSSLSKPQAYMYGGRALSPECTSGFSVKSISTTSGFAIGARGIVTASHCVNALKDGTITLTWRKGIDSGPYDVQWHTAPLGYAPTNQIQYTTGLYRSITSTKASGTQLIGEIVCKYGRTTARTCGSIKSKTFKPDNHYTDNGSSSQTTHTATFIRVAPTGPLVYNLSSPGDSGGPWYAMSDGIAYGIHTGEPSSVVPASYDAFYMPIDYLSGIGVAVLTTP